MKLKWKSLAPWVLLTCLLGGAVYCILRINEVESDRFLGARLNENLVFEGWQQPELLDQAKIVVPGERIVAVDDKEVASLDDFRESLRGEHHVPVRLTLRSPSGARRDLVFWDMARMPTLRSTSSGVIDSEDTLPGELEALLKDAQLLSLNGGSDRVSDLQKVSETHPWWLAFTAVSKASDVPLSFFFWRSDYRSPWTLLLVGICFGGLGLTVQQMRAQTQSSHAFLFFSYTLALFFLLRSIPGFYRLEWERQAFGLILCALLTSSIQFVGTFTSLRTFYSRTRSYGPISVVAGLVLLIAWMVLDAPTFLILWSSAFLTMVVAIFSGPKLLRLKGLHLDVSDRQRNRIAAIALTTAFGPALVFLLLDALIEMQYITVLSHSQLPSRYWFDLPAIFFPLLIGYAVVRRNLLQVNEMLVEGATYGLLVLGAGGIFATFVGLAVPVVERIRPGSSVLVTGVGAGLVAWSAYPVLIRFRQKLEERFHQSLRGYDTFMRSLSDLGESSPDRTEFCRQFLPSLQELTRASALTVVLPGQESPMPISCGSGSELYDSAEASAIWRQIFEIENQSPRELQREELLDAVRATEDREELLDALDALRLLFIFPLLSEGVLHGVVGVSGKVDDRNYSRSELQKLRLVARECALALYGFTVRENMRAKREAEEKLRLSQEKIRESQKLEAVATLAGGIAHDFHNLITAIFAFTGVAKETLPYDHPAAGAIENVEEAARQANGITKSLLVFTKKGRSEKRPLNLSVFVPRAVRFVRAVLPRNVELSCEVPDDQALWVCADETQLHQVIMNLVVNARDALPEGGAIRIRVARVSSEPTLNGTGSQRIRLEVADNGFGMSPEVRRRALEPFFTTKHEDRGAGLGLSIVRGIVSDNGGSLELESEPGQGSRIQIEFPEGEQGSEIVGVPRLSGSEPSRGKSVLVFEREEMVRMSLETRLKHEGLHVQTLFDLHDFETTLSRRKDFDLLVFDLDDSGADAHEIIDRLLEEQWGCPVLFLTEATMIHIEHADYQDITLLNKPFGMPGFVHAVNDCLASRVVSHPSPESAAG